jgi:NAD(P)-dependent dehydrogenase (short-subunit alcohol dehydrogenase family)
MGRVLEGKVFVLTGASRGIGAATASALAEAGGKVVLGDLTPRGEEVAAEISKKGGQAVFVKMDVTKKTDVQRLVDTAVSKFGRLDGAVNNAAICKAVGRTADVADENWDLDIAVNLTGVFYCLKAEINQILKQGNGGSIVNIASAGGLVGLPNQCAYIASKHGVVGLTKAAALEYALDKIRVNAVCPGLVDTELVQESIAKGVATMEQFASLEPVGRLGQPSEIADTIVFLLSDATSFITGTALSIDGGFVAR